jgi:intracellular septation protein
MPDTLAQKKPNGVQAFLLGGLLPVVAFTVIEGVYGTAAGLVAGMVFGAGEMLYEYWSRRKIQGITIASNMLVVGLGGLSLIENNGVFFKLQPAILTFAFAGFLLGSGLMKRPLLLALARKQRGDLPPAAEALLTALNWRLGLCMIAIGLVGVYAAFYWSTVAWASFKALGAPVLLGLYMAIEFLFAKLRARKK